MTKTVLPTTWEGITGKPSEYDILSASLAGLPDSLPIDGGPWLDEGVLRFAPVDPLRLGFFNIYLGLANSTHRAAVQAQINRVQPDIMGLSEINSADHALLPTLIDYLPNVVTQPGNLQPALITRLPIISSGSLGSTPPANEFKRKHLWAILDTGSAKKNLLIYVIHTESYCYVGPCAAESRPQLEFPRAIEWQRLATDIQQRMANDPNLEVVVMGDWNDDNQAPQTDSFASQPSGVFAEFVLGSDITFPVQYGRYPNYQCEQAGLTLVEALDTDGDRNTMWANSPNPGIGTAVKIDYMAHSPAIRTTGYEIINSEVTDQSKGIDKFGAPLPFGTSRAASDHKMIVTDVTLPVTVPEPPVTLPSLIAAFGPSVQADGMDWSGNSRASSLLGGTTIVENTEVGGSLAYNLTGAGSIQINKFNYTLPLTISAWVKTNTLGDADGRQCIFDCRTLGLNGIPFHFEKVSGVLLLKANQCSSSFIPNSDMQAGEIPVNEWTHVTLRVNAPNAALFINGEQIATSTGWSATQTIGTADFQIGGINLPAVGITSIDNFSGLIDDFRWYDTPLSDEQILLLASKRGT